MGVALDAGEMHVQGVVGVAFAPDGGRLLSASTGGAVEIFELVSEDRIRKTKKLRMREAQRVSQTLSGVASGAIAVGGDEASPACLPYGPLLAFDGHGGYLSGGVKPAEAKVGNNDPVVHLCAPPPPPLKAAEEDERLAAEEKRLAEVRAHRGGRRDSASLAGVVDPAAYVAGVAALDAHLRSTQPFIVATAFLSGSVRVLDVTAR